MGSIPYHPLIEVSEEEIKKSREAVGITDVNVIRESIKSIEDWCRKEPHLAEASQHLTPVVIERVYMLAKGSVEATKDKLDKLLTCRRKFPDIMMNRNIDEFEDMGVKYIVLPKLHPVDQSRIMVTRFEKDKTDDFNLLAYFRYGFMIGEYRLHHDYTFSERYILDLANAQLNMVSKMNPVLLKKAEYLCTEGFGTRIKGIHILNAPSFVDKIVFLLKQALKEKVAKRLHVHNSYEDLYEHIPRECLPKDYGGDQPSCSKIDEQWQEELKSEKARRIVKESDYMITNEKLRINPKVDEDFMGIHGNFRKLNVD